MILEKTLEDLKEGKEQALDSIINQFEESVYNTCLGFVQNENDAEEITQDVFIKIFKHISSFKGDAAFTTWMYRIAVNECLMFQRKKKSKKRLGLFGWFGTEKEDPIEFDHPGVVLEKKENAKILFRAIQKLPENQKTAIVLKNLEGLSQQEIGAILEISIGAVESLLQRAKQNLKKEIENNLI